MMLYGVSDVATILRMPAKSFFALLNEGSKIELQNIKIQATIASLPHMEEDDRQRFTDSLITPDDILSDIIRDEQTDDINAVKGILNGD